METYSLNTFENNSERELLNLLKKNSFLFYYLIEQKRGIQQTFRKASFSNKSKYDFILLMTFQMILNQIKSLK